MKRFLLICSLFLTKLGFSQAKDIQSSNAYIQTCIDKTQCFSINNSAFLFYDEPKASFYLKLDLLQFKTGEDTLDDWLDDLRSTYLYVKVPLPKEAFFGGLSNFNKKVFKINGQALINGVWHEELTELALSAAEPDNLNVTTGPDPYTQVKASFSLVLQPRNYKVHRGSHNLRKTIYIGVHSGRINLLRDNLPLLLGEAYDHE